MTADVNVIVMAKAPVPGRVKTRLCPPLTQVEAAAVAEASLADTLATVVATPNVGRRVVALDGEPGPWLPDGFDVVVQMGDGFGARLAHAFAAVGGPAVAIAGDTPQLTPRLLGFALDTLDGPDGEPGNDAILGPTYDGGYWLIGLSRPDSRVFDQVPMSVPTTCAAQLARLYALGFGVRELPWLRDVDTIDDARAVAEAAPHTRFAATLADILLTVVSP